MDQETVVIDKLVHGGQGLATLKDGRKVFVWNALPGETVTLGLTKRKKSYCEAIATEVIVASKHRIEPKEPEIFLGSSPWQIMDFDYENIQKKEIAKELFEREGLSIADTNIVYGQKQWNYRNKMEYSFWADENGLHLALFNRGSHQKQIIGGSALAMNTIDDSALDIIMQLNALKIRGSQLKTLMLRSTQKGVVVASLFVKEKTFPELSLMGSLKGLEVYYSEPKSPASVMTECIYKKGELILTDEVAGMQYEYSVTSFFQGNIDVYSKAIERMREYCPTGIPLIDMYSGVGSIGLSLSVESQDVTLVEIDASSVEMARRNGRKRAEIVHASTEKALDFITSNAVVVFDPPRAGLHSKVIDRVLEELPETILYLSCNPATQARDIKFLNDAYNIHFAEVYNFFPKTPHIECLIVLKKK